ncbi:hypothetical protein CENSYa_0816 [Cenarchaeum symbiosum A]|uniref:Uncharacterized protein n=1 Tax=Cenarchaeum symbiosum (strain A) TaxID=414004 RepID=A0RVT2_CENSY|nr:hypothetical protein CENSYa_0816 [Cenarchaeum symbiosum A]
MYRQNRGGSCKLGLPANMCKCLNSNQIHGTSLNAIIPGMRSGMGGAAVFLAAALVLCTYGGAAYGHPGHADMQVLFTGGAIPVTLATLYMNEGGEPMGDGPSAAETVRLEVRRGTVLTEPAEPPGVPQQAIPVEPLGILRSAILVEGDTGTLTITFEGALDASSVDTTKFHIRDGYAASGGATLPANYTVGADNRTVIVEMDSAILQIIRGYTSPRIHFETGALVGADGLSFPQAFELPRPRHVESFPLFGIENDPEGITFAPDGSRMFTSGGSGNLRQFELDPPFSIDAIPGSARSATKLPPATGPNGTTTGLYATENDLAGITFDPRGTRFYIAGDDTDTVRQYSLDIPYDIRGNITFDGLFNVSGEVPVPEAIEFGPGGINMYVAAAGSDASIYRYVLAEAFNVSTASYTGDSLNVLSNETRPTGVRISPDGYRLFIVGEMPQSGPDSVFEYGLTRAFDITSAVYEGRFPSVAEATMRDLAFADDGTQMYIMGHLTRSIHRYDLNAPYEIVPPISAVLDVSANQTSPEGSAFSGDGRHIFVIGKAGPTGDILRYPLSSPFDLGTAGAPDQLFQTTPNELKPHDMEFSNDGLRMFVIGDSDNIVQFNLSAAFDIGPGSPPVFAGSNATTFSGDTIDISAQDQTGLDFSPNGTYMYVTANNGLIQYVLDTPYDASSVSSSLFFDTRLRPLADGEYAEDEPGDVAFSADGTRMFVTGDRVNVVHTYVLPTPFDLSTATHLIHDGLFNVVDFGDNIRGLEFSPDGLRMVVTFENPDALVEYATATYPVVVMHDVAAADSPATADFAPVDFTGVQDQSDNLGAVDYVLLSHRSPEVLPIPDAPELLLSTLDGEAAVLELVFDQPVNGTLENIHIDSATTNDTVSLGNAIREDAGNSSVIRLVLDSDDLDPIRSFNSFTLRFDPGAVTGADNSTFPPEFALPNSTEEFDTSVSVIESPTGLAFSADGTMMFISGGADGVIQGYSMDAPYDISGASQSTNYSLAGVQDDPRDVGFSEDGTRLFVLGKDPPAVQQYDLGASFNVSRTLRSATYDLSAYAAAPDVSTFDAAPEGLAFGDGGRRMYVVDQSAPASVRQYTLGSGYDVSQVSYAGSFRIVGAGGPMGDELPTGVAFAPDGRFMFVSENRNSSILVYFLESPFDVQSAAYNESLNVTGLDESPAGLAFSSDGFDMFVLGGNGAVYQNDQDMTPVALLAMFPDASGPSPGAGGQAPTSSPAPLPRGGGGGGGGGGGARVTPTGNSLGYDASFDFASGGSGVLSGSSIQLDPGMPLSISPMISPAGVLSPFDMEVSISGSDGTAAEVYYNRIGSFFARDCGTDAEISGMVYTCDPSSIISGGASASVSGGVLETITIPLQGEFSGTLSIMLRDSQGLALATHNRDSYSIRMGDAGPAPFVPETEPERQSEPAASPAELERQAEPIERTEPEMEEPVIQEPARPSPPEPQAERQESEQPQPGRQEPAGAQDAAEPEGFVDMILGFFRSIFGE